MAKREIRSIADCHQKQKIKKTMMNSITTTRSSSPRLLLLKQRKRSSSSQCSLHSEGIIAFATMALGMATLFVTTCLILHRHLSLLSSSSSSSSSHSHSSLTLRRPSPGTFPWNQETSFTSLPPRRMVTTPSDLPYDIYHCPDIPPPTYPYEWNILQVLDHWSIDETDLPVDNYLHQGLCVWDARVHQTQIATYLRAEVPFVLQQAPQVVATAARWSTPGYVNDLLGHRKQSTEHSRNNHFLFWRPLSFMTTPKDPAPIDHVDLTFAEWHDKAQALQQTNQHQATQEHWYFRINGIKRMQENMFLYDELPFFNVEPNNQSPTWFMVEPDQERGINCRFGMKGAFAASHFDPTRNWIALLGGQRRYLLSNYTQCANLQLYPIDHPSQRHSMVDWSYPREYIEEHPSARSFAQATVNEVVLQAGDALYLPTSWFHAIVSLDINYQCNARSGVTTESFEVLHECGFGT